MKKIPQPLTEREELELKELSKKVFNGNLFVMITDEQAKSPEVKRLDELMSKKMNFMAMQLQYRRMALLN